MINIIVNSRFSASIHRIALAAACLPFAFAMNAAHAQTADNDWKSHTIAPVANPIYFEDPQINSTLQPVFMEHRLPDTFHFQGGTAPLGGDVQVFAAQLRYAVNDRLAIIATKDGYIALRPDNTLSHGYGWANIAAGLKYACIDDKARELIVTPGFTIEVPTGNTAVFQGRGAGLWNVFVSAEKGWSDFHLTGNAGVLIPDDFSKQTAQAHYSAQADYYVCQYFIPFAAGNGYTVLSEGENKLLGAVDLNTEMNDLIDFGSTRADGRTQFILGAGFRSRLVRNLDLGFAYEYGVTNPQGIFKDRFTVDFIWRF